MNTDPRTKVIPAGTPVQILYHNGPDRGVELSYPYFFEPEQLHASEIFNTVTVTGISKSIYGYEVDPKYIENRELMEVE